jgi:hypothetical protein
VVIKKDAGAAKEVEEEQSDAEMKDAEEDDQEAKKDEIKRKKIQFFKFWPKHLLQSAWKTYAAAGEEGNNLNAAYLAVQVFDKVTQQFVLNQMKK